MIEYVLVSNDRPFLVGTSEQIEIARTELRESGVASTSVWEAPFASLEEAEAHGYEGARVTGRGLRAAE
jgi:hypothetical protein